MKTKALFSIFAFVAMMAVGIAARADEVSCEMKCNNQYYNCMVGIDYPEATREASCLSDRNDCKAECDDGHMAAPRGIANPLTNVIDNLPTSVDSSARPAMGVNREHVTDPFLPANTGYSIPRGTMIPLGHVIDPAPGPVTSDPKENSKGENSNPDCPGCDGHLTPKSNW